MSFLRDKLGWTDRNHCWFRQSDSLRDHGIDLFLQLLKV